MSELVKGLTLRGHEVVLFATGDSRAPCATRALFDKPVWPPELFSELAHSSWAANEILKASKPFDLIHAHASTFLAFAPFLPDIPIVYTLHHDRNEAQSRYYREQASEIQYIAISERQASLHSDLSLVKVIHHGLDPELYPAGQGQGGYLAFLGRIAEVKGPDTAIEVAKLAGKELRIGGGHHETDARFYEDVFLPLTNEPHVRLLGELSHGPKISLLADAEALLFPVRWEEPFGLVMIEAMLCGCPVVAFAGGAVGEVVEDGITGFIAKDFHDMVRLVREEVPRLDRSRIRQRALERFSCHQMVENHVKLYRVATETRLQEPLPRMEMVSR